MLIKTKKVRSRCEHTRSSRPCTHRHDTLRTASLQTPPAHGLSAMEAAEWVGRELGGSVSQPSHPCQVPQQDRVAATTSRGWKTHLALATFPHRLTSRLGLPGITSHTNALHSNLCLRVCIWIKAHQCTQCCLEPERQWRGRSVP